MYKIHYLNRQSTELNIDTGELFIDNIMQLHHLTTINIINHATNQLELLSKIFEYKNIKNFYIFSNCDGNHQVIVHFIN